LWVAQTPCLPDYPDNDINRVTKKPGVKNPQRCGFFTIEAERFNLNSMRFFRPRRTGIGQPFGVVITRCGRRDCPGFSDPAGVFGMSDARGCSAMTVIVIALTAVTVAAYPMIACGFAGMIAGQTLAMTTAGGAAAMIGTTATTAVPPTIPAAVATTVSTAVTAATTATTATTATATPAATFFSSR
jgi:hypothetical protein